MISAVQQDLAHGNRVHLDGMLYALGCLCRSMDFLENEELVEVTIHIFYDALASIEQCCASSDSRYYAINASPHSSSGTCHFHDSFSLRNGPQSYFGYSYSHFLSSAHRRLCSGSVRNSLQARSVGSVAASLVLFVLTVRLI